MSAARPAEDRLLAQARQLGRPLSTPRDLTPVVEAVGDSRFVCLGEASHGTREYHRWRAELSRRLVEERGVTWIGVEGDWPDCSRINRWVRGLDDAGLDARGVLAGLERRPVEPEHETEPTGF